jgi:hypothetical protein
MPLIWGFAEAKYFLLEIWTTQISLNHLMKFISARTRFRRGFGAALEAICFESPSTDLPVGHQVDHIASI